MKVSVYTVVSTIAAVMSVIIAFLAWMFPGQDTSMETRPVPEPVIINGPSLNKRNKWCGDPNLTDMDRYNLDCPGH